MKVPVVDYRQFRMRKINTEEYRHLWWLLYWPAFLMMFLFVEQFYQVDAYYTVHCTLDDYIPFMEIFIFPYMFWFAFLVGIHIYALLYHTDVFQQMMKYIAITFSVSILIYLLFPTCQELRPEEFARDNGLTRFMGGFYQFDTNTNVCPSLHVIGSLAVLFAALHIKEFQTPVWRVFFVGTTILICMSTVFLKQHSVVDVLAALPISLAAYPMCYHKSRSLVTSPSPDTGMGSPK